MVFEIGTDRLSDGIYGISVNDAAQPIILLYAPNVNHNLLYRVLSAREFSSVNQEDWVMTFPIWTLLGFATWTLLLLLATVGTFRWSRILTGQAPISQFRADCVDGADWYKRSMRAHANCVENLPVFAAIVVALQSGDLSGGMVNILCAAVLLARIGQSLVHVSFLQTDAVVFVRFGFFFVQVLSFLCLALIIVLGK
ncbi:MAPEG family protein [Marinobacter adhaerens]|jgi:uncharacterized MAPEG superfamily protein|uniref:MAPEG family protein n=1 Tax=Marinobacter adhaerens TaxID=1033846 RepID=UPI002E7BBCCE|nr:MAPEG family protein [Marinobacter adhaerens]MCD1647274.1 MAPEG family protein [Marinobacter adhaerens]